MAWPLNVADYLFLACVHSDARLAKEQLEMFGLNVAFLALSPIVVQI